MSGSQGPSRRQVLQAFSAAAGMVALGSRIVRAQAALPASAPVITLNRDEDDAVANSPEVTWAIGLLQSALRAKNIRLADAASPALIITLGSTSNPRRTSGINSASLPKNAESFMRTVSPASPNGGPWGNILLVGADSAGLVYGLTELADVVTHSNDALAELMQAKSIAESPANPIRSICRVFVSEMEDKPWFYDQAGWEKYLDMLVTNRFNRLNLSLGLGYDFSTRVPDAYFFFAYPFFLNVAGYNVRVIDKSNNPLPDAERDKNLQTLNYIADACAKRGIHFQLGLWTHSISWPKEIANYTLTGISPETQATYSRDALHALLTACPNIKGVTIRTHGESGVPEGNFDLWKVIFSGTQNLPNGRKVEIDLHAKSITQEIIDGAIATGNPVTISPKFWAEHMGLPYMQASIRELEMPKARNGTGLMALSSGTRSFLRYGYGDLLKSNRNYKVLHRVFPGTQKLLLWGDPLFASEYGKNFTFSGTDGVEYIEPLGFKGREGSSWEVNRSCYADATLKPKAGEYDWEKYAYTFRLLGRLAYNPATDPEVWQRLLKKEYGDAANAVEKSLASASRILPLITVAHDPSAAHANYWVELYTNMPVSDASRPGPYGGDTLSPKDFSHVSSLDPQIFATLEETAESLLTHKPLGKISPLAVAAQLEQWASDADAALAEAGKTSHADDRQFRRMAVDTAIVINLGRFFASKFRAAIFFSIFDQTGHAPALTAARMAYTRARDFWAKLIDTSNGVYVDDISFGENPQLRGDWKGRLAAIETDLAALQTRDARAINPALVAAAQSAMDRVTQTPSALALQITHAPPATFRPGQPVALQFTAAPLNPAATATLFYRHLNQGERYQSTPLQRTGNTLSAQIPADYSQSPYPLEYHVHIASPGASAGTAEALYPGFHDNFLGQPYFVVQPQ